MPPRGRRLAELGNGSNTQYHTDMDIYESYSDLDYLFGFNSVQTTVGTVAGLAGATLTGCGDPPLAPCVGIPATPDWSLILTCLIVALTGAALLAGRRSWQG